MCKNIYRPVHRQTLCKLQVEGIKTKLTSSDLRDGEDNFFNTHREIHTFFFCLINNTYMGIMTIICHIRKFLFMQQKVSSPPHNSMIGTIHFDLRISKHKYTRNFEVFMLISRVNSVQLEFKGFVTIQPFQLIDD